MKPKFIQWQTSSDIASNVNPARLLTFDVVSYYFTELRLPRSNQEIGLPSPEDYKTDYIEALEVSQGGVVTVRLNQIEGHVDQGDDYTMTPMLNKDGNIIWVCEAGTIHPRYVPLSCG